MLGWLAGKGDPNYTPAAFFLHFGDGYKSGSAAAKRHLEFFRETDMDFVKIQFEQTYSRQDSYRNRPIGRSSSWPGSISTNLSSRPSGNLSKRRRRTRSS
jgi:hypothetical protein